MGAAPHRDVRAQSSGEPYAVAYVRHVRALSDHLRVAIDHRVVDGPGGLIPRVRGPVHGTAQGRGQMLCGGVVNDGGARSGWRHVVLPFPITNLPGEAAGPWRSLDDRPRASESVARYGASDHRHKSRRPHET